MCAQFSRVYKWNCWSVVIYSVQFSRSVMSDSLRPHELHHARPPCPSPTPGVYPNPCPSSRWCHPAILVICYCETNHSKSKWLKTAVVYYFLMILWVDWKVLLLGVGGLTHMSAFSWALLSMVVAGLTLLHSWWVSKACSLPGGLTLWLAWASSYGTSQRIKVDSEKCLEA